MNRRKNIQVNELNDNVIQLIRKGIWLYIILLIFEGALRKWFLPSLSSVLLIVRDPIAIGLLVYAWYHNIFPNNWYVKTIASITIISVFTALFLGHGNFSVALYGARIFLIHFPFLFLIGLAFTPQDVLRVGKFFIWLALPMTLLMIAQYYSPQSAWVNRGIGGDLGGSGFSGAMGYMRPPGTFSFTNGLVLYYNFLSVFIFYFWLNLKEQSKTLLIVATICLLLAIPFSISRSLILSLLVMTFFVMISVFQKPKIFFRILIGGLTFGIIIFGVISTGIMDEPLEVYAVRFESAANSEGGLEGTIGERYLGNKYLAITKAAQGRFFGEGIGMGTNAGSVLLGNEKPIFLIAEDEWQRLVGELGAVIGILVIAIRVFLTAKMGLNAFYEIGKNRLLPWILFGFVSLNFPQGAWAQPTMLGFAVVGMGLLIASFNDN